MKKDKKINASLIKDYPVTDERKTFQNMVDNHNKIIKSTVDPEFKKTVKTSFHVKYPKEFLRFDAGFINESSRIIQNPKILEDLRGHFRNLKMLWESYTSLFYIHHEEVFKSTSSNKSLNSEFPNKDDYYFEFGLGMPEDVIILLMTSIAYLKILNNNPSLHTKRSSINDKDLIIHYLRESLDNLKKSQRMNSSQWNYEGFHPFYRIFSCHEFDDIQNEISKSEFKKYEQYFIRDSNSRRKFFKDEFKKVLIKQKKIRLMRLDVLDRNFTQAYYFNSDKYRADINHAIKRIQTISKNNLILTANVIFPRNFIRNSSLNHSHVIGHLVLFFNANAFNIDEKYGDIVGSPYYGNTGSEITFSNIEAGGPSFKSIGAGLLKSSNPHDFIALDDIAEYMTLERRFINPSASFISSAGILDAKHVGHKIFILEKF